MRREQAFAPNDFYELSSHFSFLPYFFSSLLLLLSLFSSLLYLSSFNSREKKLWRVLRYFSIYIIAVYVLEAYV